MLGVIICPKCHRARGVSLSSKKVRCSHCGKSIDVSLAKVYHRTEDREELVLAVQRMTEKLAQGIEDYPAERKRRARAPPAAIRARGSTEEDLRSLAARLSVGKGHFSLEELMAESKLDEESAMRLLDRMVAGAVVYEPVPGRFKPL